MNEVSYSLAFAGGVLSFLSPCVLPLIPSYISFITGISYEGLKSGDKSHIRKITFMNSLAFVTGFTIVLLPLGVASSFLNSIFHISFTVMDTRISLYQLGGLIIIFFGLYIMGLFKIGFLSMEHRIHLHSKPRGYLGSLIVGLTFAAGWTPCFGPILGSILMVSGATGSAFNGFMLMLAFSAGLGIPFLITSMAINSFLSHFRGIQKYMRLIMILSGLLLIVFGVLLLTDSLEILRELSPELNLAPLE